jgi:hypothetical protein
MKTSCIIFLNLLNTVCNTSNGALDLVDYHALAPNDAVISWQTVGPYGNIDIPCLLDNGVHLPPLDQF